jgi:N-acetylmuramic acid 6-phosphate etherase
MLSTATMVRLGRVFSNLMIQVQLTNTKLRRRAEGILMESTGVTVQQARKALRQANHSLPVAILMLARGVNRTEALKSLQSGPSTGGVVRRALAKHRLRI